MNWLRYICGFFSHESVQSESNVSRLPIVSLKTATIDKVIQFLTFSFENLKSKCIGIRNICSFYSRWKFKECVVFSTYIL